MKSQCIHATLIVLISLSACVPPRPVTPTSVPTIVPAVAPSETSVPINVLPTNTAQPSLQIIDPVDPGVVNCLNPVSEGFCLFHVRGTTGGVSSISNFRVYVFVFPVNPPGEGWYLQKSPAAIESSGDWTQSPSYIGSAEVPAIKGQIFQIRAALVNADATFRGNKLANLAISNNLIVLPAIEDIEGIVALSDIVDLTLDK